MRAAVLFGDQNDFAEAERRFDLALDAAAQLGVADPRHERALEGLVDLYEIRGRAHDGANLLEHWMPELEASLAPGDPRLARHLEQWAWFCYQEGRFASAEAHLLRALANRNAAPTPDTRHIAMARHRLGLVFQAQEKWGPAAVEQREALRLLEGIADDADLDLARVRTELAGLYVIQGRWREAEPLIEKGLPALQNRLRGALPILLHGLAYRAMVRLESGAGATAVTDVDHLLFLYDRNPVGSKSAEQELMVRVGEACERAGRLEQAEDIYLRVAAFLRSFGGIESLETGAMTYRLGRVLLARGRLEEAEGVLRRSMVAYENAEEAHPTELAAVLDTYALLLEETERPEQASRLRQRAARLRSRQ